MFCMSLAGPPGGTRRGSESTLFWGYTKRAETAGLWGSEFGLEGCSVREAASLPGSSSLGLKRSQAQQGEPMRMVLADHQLPWALAVALGASATHEAAMVQEEPQQIQVRVAQVAA